MRFLRSLILGGSAGGRICVLHRQAQFIFAPQFLDARARCGASLRWRTRRAWAADESNNIDVYKAAKDSVVSVTSTVVQRGFFFDEQGHAVGSGFLIDSDGRILTNFHVISASSDVEVTLPDQTIYKAKVLVRDRPDDLALIKIEPKKKLSHLNLGDSDHLQVGTKGAGDRESVRDFHGDADGGRGQLARPPHPDRE